MKDFLKTIQDYKESKYKNEHILIIYEKSKKLSFPIYSLIKLLESIEIDSVKIISDEGWIEKYRDRKSKIIEQKNKKSDEEDDFKELKNLNNTIANSKQTKIRSNKVWLIILIVLIPLLVISIILYIDSGLSNEINEDSSNIKDNELVNEGDNFKEEIEEIVDINEEKGFDDLEDTHTNKTYTPSDENSNIFGKYPEASTRYLKSNYISHLSKWELKIMRNEIFARYGYVFKTDEMSNYFNNIGWYRDIQKLDYNNDASNLLTDIEKKNIKLIQQYE